MQVGTNPFSQPGVLPTFRTANDGKKAEEAPGAKKDVPQGTQNDGGEEITAKDPVDILRERLKKESEPTEADKLRAKIAKNVVEKFRELQERLNPQNKNNNPLALNPLSNLKKPTQNDSSNKTDETPKEETQKPEEENPTNTKPQTPIQGGGNALDLKDFNLVPMTDFKTSKSVSYEATYDKETGQATQEMMYSNTYSFTFSGTVVDKNGNKHNIEANVTLTHSVYTKITGGSDTLDPKVLEELQKGNPFNFSYDGDGSDLKDQDFGFLFDDGGTKDQISSNNSIFGDLIDKAFGEGLGSLLEGLRIFAFGGKENTPTTLPAGGENAPTGDGSKPTKLPAFNNPFGFNNNNRPNNFLGNLIGLGEQGVGMIFFTQFQAEMLFQSSSNGNSFSASFSFTSISRFGDDTKDKNTLEAILEQQKLLAQKKKEGNNPADVKKAVDSYNKNTETQETQNA